MGGCLLVFVFVFASGGVSGVMVVGGAADGLVLGGGIYIVDERGCEMFGGGWRCIFDSVECVRKAWIERWRGGEGHVLAGGERE